MRKLALLSLSAVFALAACGGDKPATAPIGAAAQTKAGAPVAAPVTGPKVSGSIAVDGVSTLPGGLELGVKILDVTDPAAVPTVVAERVTAAPRILPSGFEVGYDPAKIDQTHNYVVQVALQADGLVLYGVPTPTPVLTQGAGESGLALTLVKGGKPVAQEVAPPEQLKLDFQTLDAKLGALRRLKGERLDDQVAIGWDAFVDTVSGQVLMAREQVETAEGGTTAYRFAYKGGQPWFVERKQGGGKTLLGWTSEGQLILNEKADAPASDEEVESLKQRALALYATAAARR